MAGHSHWAGIKHKKALVDNKRGKLWSKLSKLIIVAAKVGGGDPVMNIRLRTAIDDAKAVSMPKENIERAIKRGTGELDGGNVEEVLYEGYGPGGVGIICEIMTDNRNRTAPEIRKLFEIHGGNLGSTGCVAHGFDTKGLILVLGETCPLSEDELFELVLENGGEDVKNQDGNYEIIAPPEDFSGLKEALEAQEIPLEMAEITMIPNLTVDLDAENAREVLALMEKLDDHDDVQKVHANYNIPDDVMAEIDQRAAS